MENHLIYVYAAMVRHHIVNAYVRLIMGIKERVKMRYEGLRHVDTKSTKFLSKIMKAQKTSKKF
jgi:hypothetical protein